MTSYYQSTTTIEPMTSFDSGYHTRELRLKARASSLKGRVSKEQRKKVIEIAEQLDNEYPNARALDKRQAEIDQQKADEAEQKAREAEAKKKAREAAMPTEDELKVLRDLLHANPGAADALLQRMDAYFKLIES
jgi:hypothetical protein